MLVYTNAPIKTLTKCVEWLSVVRVSMIFTVDHFFQ